MVMAPPLEWNRIAGRVRRLRGRPLDRRACDSERYVDVAARCPRIGADLMRPRHEVGGLRAIDPRRVEVEHNCEPEAALALRADSDSGGHARAGEVDLPPAGEAQQARLEAGRIAGGEELLRVRPGPPVPPISVGTSSSTSSRPSDVRACPSRPPSALASAVYRIRSIIA